MSRWAYGSQGSGKGPARISEGPARISEGPILISEVPHPYL